MKHYRDEIAMVCHDIMKAGRSVGAVSNAEMQEFEKNCFVQDSETIQETPLPEEMEHISTVPSMRANKRLVKNRNFDRSCLGDKP
jgi:hypothetical protein